DSTEMYYLSAKLLSNADQLTQPRDPADEMHYFVIESGESVASISNRLQAEGYLSSPEAFRTFLFYAGLDTILQAGEHEVSAAMSAMQIAHELKDPTPARVTLSILAGWRSEEIAAALPASGLGFTPADFLRIVKHPPSDLSLPAELPAGASLEGFLFPGNYTIERRMGAEECISLVLVNFAAQVTPAIQQAFAGQGLSLYEAVTLASIVEREAVLYEEMPAIASVFYNRLAAGMKLDTDPTVQYAAGYNPVQKTWWTNPLSSADLTINSPYNTYLNPGLPPGPIANPGLAALEAVAYPAETPYYYFRAKCDNTGRHNFAETYQGHLDYACP
ncbi:MAG TPA: endolytic transglycosylase MltG, partial [Anaerolineales bacterium]|nr:endolytic transglycosylase MltG [Anaerolineales bacterium]